MKGKRKLPFFDKLMLWLNCLLCLALLVSYLAPIVDPRTIWWLPFFGLAYPSLLVANLIAILYWLIRRRWFVLLSFICIIIGWNMLLTNVGLHFGSQPAYVA